MNIIVGILTFLSITSTPIVLDTEYTQTSVYDNNSFIVTSCECPYHIELDLIHLKYTEIGVDGVRVQYTLKSRNYMTLYYANETAYVYDLENGKFLHLIFNAESNLFGVRITNNTVMNYRYTLDRKKMAISKNNL